VKLIIATVQPDKLQDIQEGLAGPDACIMYVSQVGDLRASLRGIYRGTEYTEPRPRVRLEIVVLNDLVVPDIIQTITRIAYVPNAERLSYGSILVMPLEAWVQISADQPGPVLDESRATSFRREAS
jgi:nitrogen regulatory protein PII